ncbi:MAG: Gfo/Idh/MocA family oxidoreductase [Chthoniobacteraceae bacterium]
MKTRRDFIRSAAMAGAAFSILPSKAFSRDDANVRVGFIGVGLRGQSHLELALMRNDVDVIAICDIQQRMIDMSMELIKKSGKPKPQVIMDGPTGYKKLLENKNIDAVIIATPWELHYQMCIDSMNAKKYTGCEVITGMTIEECTNLRRHQRENGYAINDA